MTEPHPLTTLWRLWRQYRRGAEPEPYAVVRARVAPTATRVGRLQQLVGASPSRLPSPTLPLVAPALWEPAVLLEAVVRHLGRLPMRGLLHLTHEFVAVREAPLTGLYDVEARVAHAARGRRGLELHLTATTYSASGDLCWDNRAHLLVPEAARSRSDTPTSAGPCDDETAWIPGPVWELRPALARRYAFLSGDFNPIHLSRWTARLFGFDRPILHGYCLAALAAQAWTELEGHPPRRLAVRFRRPVRLPARLRFERAAVDPRRFRARPVPEGRPCLEGEAS